MRRTVGACGLWAACLAGAAQAAEEPIVTQLRGYTIEELSEIEVTSVSLRPEPISLAPASVFLITNDDIHRAGVTSLPEALRLAPNLQVQQIDAASYAITARGFGGFETANKLLVLIDGRSIYTPLASTVFWDLHEPLLEDLDRVEVVSGPGGALYGPNAVNGVVSIATRSAEDTQGLYAEGFLGTQTRKASMRFGGRIGDAAYRIYATGFDRDATRRPDGSDAPDAWEGLQAGFRTDTTLARGALTVQGDYFRNSQDELVEGDGAQGGNVLVRWRRDLGEDGEFQIQAYYDRFAQRFTNVFDRVDTADLQLQHNWRGGRHEIVWGAGARVTWDEFDNDLNPFVLDPEERTLVVGNVFAQDRVTLTSTLALTTGLKIERTTFTGVQPLPNLRLAYTPNERTLLWAAVSRAVRTPNRIDRQLVFPGVLEPGDTFRSEEVVAFEAGWRARARNVSWSISTFYNLYDDLRTTEPVGPGALPVRLENGLGGANFGVEAWADYMPFPWWRLSAGVSALGEDYEFDRGVIDITGGESTGQDPTYQAQLRSQWAITRDLDLDVRVRAVDELPSTRENPRVPGYVEADVRLAWRITPNAEIAFSGFNLLHDSHAESYYRLPILEPRRAFQIETRVRF